jgi:hypothetical protein
VERGATKNRKSTLFGNVNGKGAEINVILKSVEERRERRRQKERRETEIRVCNGMQFW